MVFVDPLLVCVRVKHHVMLNRTVVIIRVAMFSSLAGRYRRPFLPLFCRLQVKKGHFVTRDDSEPVFVHPSSVNHQRFTTAAESGRQVRGAALRVNVYANCFVEPAPR